MSEDKLNQVALSFSLRNDDEHGLPTFLKRFVPISLGVKWLGPGIDPSEGSKRFWARRGYGEPKDGDVLLRNL